MDSGSEVAVSIEHPGLRSCLTGYYESTPDQLQDARDHDPMINAKIMIR